MQIFLMTLIGIASFFFAGLILNPLILKNILQEQDPSIAKLMTILFFYDGFLYLLSFLCIKAYLVSNGGDFLLSPIIFVITFNMIFGGGSLLTKIVSIVSAIIATAIVF